MNKKIESAIEKVSNSFPSLFSKEDVIKVLQDLGKEMESEPEKGPTIDLENLVESFRDTFGDNCFDDFIDKEDVELTLSYDNRIEVERVPVDEDAIINAAVDALEAVIEALKIQAREESDSNVSEE